MALILEPPTRVHELVMHEFGGSLGPDRPHEAGYEHQVYRCPSCGTLEHTDSAVAGTCPLCPGLVGLVAI